MNDSWAEYWKQKKSVCSSGWEHKTETTGGKKVEEEAGLGENI